MRLAIFGTGGMGREVVDIVRRSARLRARYDEVIFVVDAPAGAVDGTPVIDPGNLLPTDALCLAVGSPEDRRNLAQRFAAQPWAEIVSDHAIVSPSASIGPGAIICDFAVVNNGVRVGRHFLANVHAQVSHDCIVGDFVTLSPKAGCNGWIQLEDGVFVGAAAVIRNGAPQRRLCVGKSAVIGMGSTVLTDVPAGATTKGTRIYPPSR